MIVIRQPNNSPSSAGGRFAGSRHRLPFRREGGAQRSPEEVHEGDSYEQESDAPEQGARV